MERIKVAIRIRPFLPSEDESDLGINISPEDENTIIVSKNSKIFRGTFNQIFTPDSTQKEVFSFIKPCLLTIQKGINCTILAYGQTGTGKTYTMFGEDWTFNNINMNSKKEKRNELLNNEIIINRDSESNGIVPNLILEIYNIYNKTDSNNIIIKCSYIQIYNEKIYDLLNISEDNNKNMLKLKTDRKKGIIISGANEILASNYTDILDILEIGENNRKIRYTNKNKMSSRSHTIFMISIENKITNNITKIKLCDLAGSERYSNSKIYKREHIDEMRNINKSLFSLGNVINSLASKKKYIPYKDSLLTRILEDSLKGNSTIYLIATISPFEKNSEETFHTLKFADCAHNIMIKINNNDNDIIRNNSENNINILKDEVSGLKNLISLRYSRNKENILKDKFFSLQKENNDLKRILSKGNSINYLDNIIKENNKLKKELKIIKINYNNLKNEINKNKIKAKSEKNEIILPNINIKNIKVIKSNLSQENINLKNKKNFKILKKEISTENINKINRKAILDKYKFNKVQNKKINLDNVISKNKINIYGISNRFRLKNKFKKDKLILDSLQKLQLLNNLKRK